MVSTDLEFLNLMGLPVFVLDVDADGQPVYSGFNNEARVGLGTRAQHAIGKTAEHVYEGRMGSDALAHHREVIKTRRRRTYDITLPLGGINRHIRTTLTPIPDDSGNVARLIGVCIDRTEEVRALEAQMKFASVAKEVEDFISLAAHDLRTPMRHIRAIAEMLRDDFKDLGDGKLEMLSTLEDIAVKTSRVISDILQHTQLAEMEHHQETFDFSHVCAEIFTMLDPHNNHDLMSSAVRLTSDKAAIQIVLRNLIDNAIKHSARESVGICVSVRQIDQERVEIAVQDNGAGFPDPALAFLGAGEVRSESGFGLLGIRRLITARGGTISAENVPDGRGCNIRMTLDGQLVDASDGW